MAELLKDIITCIEQFAPPVLQESWDNSGLLVGNQQQTINSAVISLDITEAIVDDAIAHGDNLIIGHHPLIFSGIKRLNGKTDVERAIIKAIQNNIAIYAAHTNLDVVRQGVSWKMAEKLGLQNIKTLSPQKGLLKKLVTFVPVEHIEEIRTAVFNAGAGHIGQYDSCSFNVEGNGSFRGDENSRPFVGEKEKLHFEKEIRFETIFAVHQQHAVIQALLNAHPYEEVAYDIYPLENSHPQVGLGVIASTSEAENTMLFLKKVKDTFGCDAIKYTPTNKPTISRVALCGGAGSSLLRDAVAAGADIFITGDIKYHQFFEGEGKIIITDIGHYESEQFTKELFYEIVTNKFSKFALRLSKVQTNPVKYLF